MTALVASVLLWFLLGLSAFLRGLDDGVAHALGALMGTLGFSLLLALAIRWLYLRADRRPIGLWSPWTFVIAASIALLSTLGAVASTLSDRARDSQEGNPAKDGLASEVLVDLPSGLRYAPSPMTERQELERSFRAQSPPGSDVDVRRVVTEDGARGLVIAIAAESARSSARPISS